MPNSWESDRGKFARLNRIRSNVKRNPLYPPEIHGLNRFLGSGFLNPLQIWNPDPREIQHECGNLCTGTVHCDIVALEAPNIPQEMAIEVVKESYSEVFGQVVEKVIPADAIPNWRDIFDTDEMDIVRPSSSGRWGSHWIVYWTMTIEAKGIVIITPKSQELADGENGPKTEN